MKAKFSKGDLVYDEVLDQLLIISWTDKHNPMIIVEQDLIVIEKLAWHCGEFLTLISKGEFKLPSHPIAGEMR